MKISRFLTVSFLMILFFTSAIATVSTEVLVLERFNVVQNKQVQIPLYIKEYFKDIKKFYENKDFVFSFNRERFVILFGKFRNPKEGENYNMIVEKLFALVIFDEFSKEEKSPASVLIDVMDAFNAGYTDNIKKIFLYGSDVSVSWSRDIDLLKAEIKCLCGCAVGLFSKDICMHKDCPMDKIK